jgi:hypothetical protein
VKKITTWRKCEYPGCPVETDHGYEIQRKGKKIKLCEGCYKKLKEKENAISENIHA